MIEKIMICKIKIRTNDYVFVFFWCLSVLGAAMPVVRGLLLWSHDALFNYAIFIAPKLKKHPIPYLLKHFADVYHFNNPTSGAGAHCFEYTG